MTSQSDIQWVDLCVFVYVTILCLSLATLSICEPPSIKHVSAPCLESREEFSSTHFPAFSKSHRLCTLNLPPGVCAFLAGCVYVWFLCLFHFLCENLAVWVVGITWLVGFCMMYACLHPMIRTAGAFMRAFQPCESSWQESSPKKKILMNHVWLYFFHGIQRFEWRMCSFFFLQWLSFFKKDIKAP